MKNKTLLYLLLILFIALLFRLPMILNSQSFWFDEMVSFDIAKKSIIDSWQYLQWENNPPLHYWYLHYWIKIFGESEIVMRLSSLLFGLLNVIAIYFLGKKIKNKTVGLFAAFLLAISSLQVFLSMDARMYQMLLFFSILAFYFFWETLYNYKLRYLLLAIICTLLALYTHLTGLYILIAINLYFLYHYFHLKNKNFSILKWTTGQLIVVLLFFPWFYFFIVNALSRLNSSAWYLSMQGEGFIFFDIPFSLLMVGKSVGFIQFFTFIIFFFLILLSVANIKNLSNLNDKEVKIKFIFLRPAVFSLILFLSVLLIGCFFEIWTSKYYLIGSIGFYLLLAIGFDKLKNNKKLQQIVILFLLMISFIYNGDIFANKSQNKWDEVADFIMQNEKTDDVIFMPAFVYEIVLDYYYRGNLDITIYESLPFESDKLLRSVKYNWYSTVDASHTPNLDNLFMNTDRVFVIDPLPAFTHNTSVFLNWFHEKGWLLEDRQAFGGFDQPNVLIFKNPNY